MSSAILRHAVTCLSVRFSYKQQNDNWKEGTINGFTTYHNQFFLTAGTHRWSDGASTTKHSFVSQRLLDGRWPPAVSCKKLPTANCSLLGVWCLWLIVRPTPPPHIHLDMTFFYYHDFFSDCFPRFKGSIPKYEKQRLIVLAQLKILLAWSADRVSWKQTLTHTRRPLRANVLFIHRKIISRVKRSYSRLSLICAPYCHLSHCFLLFFFGAGTGSTGPSNSGLVCFGDSSSASCSKMFASAGNSTSSVTLSSSMCWLLGSACVVLARRLLGGGVCVPGGVCLCCCCLFVLLICIGLFGGIALTGVRCVALCDLLGLLVRLSGGVFCLSFNACFNGETAVPVALAAVGCCDVGETGGNCGCLDWRIASCNWACSRPYRMFSSVHSWESIGPLSRNVSSGSSGCIFSGACCWGRSGGKSGSSGAASGGWMIVSMAGSHHIGAVIGSLANSKMFCLKSLTVLWSSTWLSSKVLWLRSRWTSHLKVSFNPHGLSGFVGSGGPAWAGGAVISVGGVIAGTAAGLCFFPGIVCLDWPLREIGETSRCLRQHVCSSVLELKKYISVHMCSQHLFRIMSSSLYRLKST